MHVPLKPFYSPDTHFEIGVDEAGRGPMFGRLYVAGVILPKDTQFRHDLMKDSKKFHSEKKIKDVSEYIKTHAIAWHIEYIESNVIDEINIRQSVFRGMHACIKNCLRFVKTNNRMDDISNDVLLLVDGNDFAPYLEYDCNEETMREIPFVTVEGGDNTYSSIAAASILAKVARDEYIADMCAKYPALNTKYGLAKNKGYGTKLHLDGIRTYGITQWHRKTFGLCAHVTCNPILDDHSSP